MSLKTVEICISIILKIFMEMLRTIDYLSKTNMKFENTEERHNYRNVTKTLSFYEIVLNVQLFIHGSVYYRREDRCTYLVL